MRLVNLLAIGVLFALPIANATTGSDQVLANATDTIVVTPDHPIVHPADLDVGVNVIAPDASLLLRPRASLIIYAPDGTRLKSRPRRLRAEGAKFRVYFGSPRQTGTYTVYATVEVDSQAFGMPTKFEVATD
jgi:hypothetical protein